MKKPIKRILITVGLVVLAAISYIGFDILRTATQIPEAYAAWDAATLVIEYMDTHDGAWPRSWDELLTAAKTLPKDDRRIRGTPIDQLSTRVRIDWDADPRKLAEAIPDPDALPFRVITRADGSDFPTLWSGAEPNTLILEYLKQKDANKALQAIGAKARLQPER